MSWLIAFIANNVAGIATVAGIAGVRTSSLARRSRAIVVAAAASGTTAAPGMSLTVVRSHLVHLGNVDLQIFSKSCIAKNAGGSLAAKMWWYIAGLPNERDLSHGPVGRTPCTDIAFALRNGYAPACFGQPDGELTFFS